MPPLLLARYVVAFISWPSATARAGKAPLFLFSLAVLLAGGASVVRGQSALDGFDPNANGTINVVVVQPDGKVLLGGDFTTLSPNGGAAVTRNRIARLNPDGTLDTGFDPNADFSVYSIAVQVDGKILVGGGFASIGGQPRNLFARLDGATGLADSFDPNPNATVYSIAVQSDGKILVAGPFDSIGGGQRRTIARLDSVTGLADSFNPNPDAEVYSIAVQANGKILAGGLFTSIGGQPRNRIARLNASGLADSFNPNANGIVLSIAVQADGKVLVGGYLTSVSGQARNRIARLDATTGLVDSFDPNVNGGLVHSIVVQADGKILAVGAFQSIGGQTRSGIARLDAATGLADWFHPNPNGQVKSIAVQADGKILVGGNFTTLAPNWEGAVARNHIARLETDGRLDQTLNYLITPGVNEGVKAIAFQPDGKILLSGGFTAILGVARNNIARLNTDGTLDMAFNPNADQFIDSIVVQETGKILVGGNFNHIGGETRNYIARLDGTTGVPDSFDPNASGTVSSMAVQADGKILVAGGFESIGGQSRIGLARLDPTTGLADSFDAHPRNSTIAIEVQADGKILAGGTFFGTNSIGGQTRNYIARVDGATGLADSFDPNSNQWVTSIVTQPDGRILVAGWFSDFKGGTLGGQPRNHIARLEPVTGLADSFNPNANNVVAAIAVQADGKVLAVGSFNGASSIGGRRRDGIARLDGTTGLADSFNPSANSTVDTVALQADGKILAGGNFLYIGGWGRTHFVRLSNDTAALQNLAVTQTSITWARGGSSPQLSRATFEYSTDNLNYTPLGNGTPAGSSWTRTGLNFSPGQNFYIRARGYYRSGLNNNSESITESVRNAFVAGPPAPPTPTPTPAPAAQPLNLSTRMRVQTGDSVGIAGIIITGTAPKHLLLRVLGPSLYDDFGKLADPVLELHGPAPFATIINDNWKDDPGQRIAIQATGLAPYRDEEPAIDATLNPGSYTAVVRGKNNTSGSALIEVYDLSQAVAAKLSNISTRAFVGTNFNVLIAGFILGGNSGPDRIVARGIGPSLANLGVPDALANPGLELRDQNGMLQLSNSDWQDDPAQAAEIAAAGLAPSNNLEAAIATTLPPGAYTVLVYGESNTIGVGLVEIYDRGAP